MRPSLDVLRKERKVLERDLQHTARTQYGEATLGLQ